MMKITTILHSRVDNRAEVATCSGVALASSVSGESWCPSSGGRADADGWEVNPE